MFRSILLAGASFLLFFNSLGMAQAPNLPPLNGVVPDVSSINTAALLAQMNHGSPNSDLVLVAAHRGYWINAPENSATALNAAFTSGVEVIEIDLRTTSDNHLVISHDPDLIKETTGSGLVSQTTEAAIEALQLRDRKGNPQNMSMLTFEAALTILKNLSIGGRGPVIIADLKDPNPWPGYLEGVKDVAAKLDGATQPAVVFKMKMKNLPSIATIQTEALAHPAYGHLVLTVNPEDADPAGPWNPTSSNFQSLLQMSTGSTPFVQQFELNINNSTDGTSSFIGSNQLQSFATYWEPKFYPEGVSTIRFDSNNNPFTTCCYLPVIPTDTRGVLNFALYNNVIKPGVSLITSDNLAETLNFLTSLGLRNVAEIQ